METSLALEKTPQRTQNDLFIREEEGKSNYSFERPFH